MSTGLVKPGMKLPEIHDAVSGAAEKIRAEADTRLGVWTEIGSKLVLVGVSIKGVGRGVITIDKAEYSGIKLAEILSRGA